MSLTGRPHLHGPEGELRLPAKAYLLAAFLALSSPGRTAARARLSEALWPDEDPEKSHANLRQLLVRVRLQETRSGFRLFDATNFTVRLAADNLRVDLLEIEALLGLGKAEGTAELCRFYAGDLLEGSESEIDAGHEWIGMHRASLRELVTASLCRFLESQKPVEDAAVSVAAERLLEIDPYQEPGYRALMRAYARMGQPFQVRRVFELCRSRLSLELGALPTPETSALFQQLARGSSRATAGEAAAPLQEGVQPHAGVPRLSILTPSDASGRSDKQSLVAWLLQDVTVGLCSLRSISIIAPFTSWSVDAGSHDGAAEKFGVDYFVLTEVAQGEAVAYLYVRLVHARSRLTHWAERFEFGLPKLATCYRDLAMRIAVSLADAVEQTELGRLEAQQDANAYRWYLSGQRDLRTLDLPSVRKAKRAFRRAQAQCPDYAPAYSGLARTFQLEWLLLARGDGNGLAESVALAERAIAMDPEDARGHHELGTSSLYARSFGQSIDCFTEAERRSPQHADLLADFGDALAHSGEPEAGLRKLGQAIALNPATPDHYYWYEAGMQYQLARYEAAIDTIAKMRDNTCALRLLAASNARLGRKREARDCVRRAMQTYPDFRIERWLAMVPNKRTEDTRHYADGLRMAGFQ